MADGGNVVATMANSTASKISSRVGQRKESVLCCAYRDEGARKIPAGASDGARPVEASASTR